MTILTAAAPAFPSQDIVIDRVRFADAVGVLEPMTWALTLAGLGLGAVLRSQRRRQQFAAV